ncbi:hypothetical protein RHMOL_Rhmol08G0173300 [Rhododendron molle]|uniref:Uncharacterized protein n=1 Tax=Rhododendron molle TaxID=49168 RepID=A0ACC0MQ26_RHOML|nr:hypothetical protein RHMOL_Rhmol08G0173300 [Rhododendron molle]
MFMSLPFRRSRRIWINSSGQHSTYPEELSASVIQNDELNIAHLIELYGPKGALGDYVGQAHRRLVLSICALAAYTLIPADGNVSPSLVSIAFQMSAKRNIMPIVLAETLMGLDLVKSSQAGSLSGCPLLLQAISGYLLVFTLVQLWLSNKVGMLEAPQPGFEHLPRYLVERPMLHPELLMVEWYAFLNDMQSEDIVWRCLWLNLQEMTVNSAGFKRVVIAGLTSFTFYIPEHILRQLRISQGNKRFGREHFELSAFNDHNLHVYRCSRNDRDFEEPLPDSITWLESRYIKWLHKEDRDMHVFIFGDNELCPTVEEFQAYLQGFASSMIVVPPYRKSMSKLLKSSLNISTGAAESLLSGGQINIMCLMEWYEPEGDTGDMALQAPRRFALVISVLAAYLLVSQNGQVDPSLVSVPAQLGARRNVVPMVLAKTLIGLDLASTDQTIVFGGSPLL